MDKRFRDPIHQFIRVEEHERAIVDLPAFQRLRGISQLALTQLVYHGARHSRFEHSLGAMHAADRVSEAVGLDDERRRIIRLAALVHDVGHGPFSHVLDFIMTRYVGEDIHEQISRAVVLEGPLRTCFENADEAGQVVDLVDPPDARRGVERDIVNGPTDADKLDYLLRDSFYCGVRYGWFDIDRVLETARVIPDGEESQLGFEEGGIEAVEGLLWARRTMHRTVYRHPTRRATDIMLQRALLLALEGGDEELSRLVPERKAGDVDLSDAYLQHYLELDDETVRRHLEGQAGPPGDLARALRHRRLAHQVVQVDRRRIQALRGGPYLSKVVDETRLTHEAVKEIESEIADDLGCESHWVFLTVESLTNPLYRAPGGEISSEVLIVGDRPPEFLGQISDIFRSDLEPSVFISLFTDGSETEHPDFRGREPKEWEEYVLSKLDPVLEGR